jgi:hypothetical protein
MPTSKKTQTVYKGPHYTVIATGDHIHSQQFGKVGIEETEVIALKTMQYMRQIDCHKLLLELHDMPWMNDIQSRIRLVELAGMARDVLYKVAFVSPSPIIRYLAITIGRGGGVQEVEAFENLNLARQWLLASQ